MTPEERRYLNAREALASERDIEKAVFRVADRHCTEDEARELLQETIDALDVQAPHSNVGALGGGSRRG